MERLTRVRSFFLFLAFCVIVGFFALRLFDIQLIETDGKTDNTKTFTTVTRVKAARGDIRDRNGNVLVSNRASYDLVFNHYVLLSSGKANQSLKTLLDLCREQQIEYIDHFPISKTAPFTSTLDDYNAAWRGYYQAFLGSRNLDSDINPTLLMQTLRTSYKIPEDWTDEEARAVIGIRYEMELRQDITNLSNYVFIEDIDSADQAAILELAIPGLKTESSTVREYHTEYAAHILGYVGQMSSAQWEEYKNKKTEDGVAAYAMDALVGQSGLEAVYEKYLHGIDGWRVDVVTADGTIVEQYYRTVEINGKKVEQKPIAGQNVELTIDLGLQQSAEDSMEQLFLGLKEVDEEEEVEGPKPGFDVEGGAVIALDIKTGQILVCASYPTYDLSRFFEDYQQILDAEFDPLYNRALQAAYPPGSVYKMSMVVAGIENKIIVPGTQIEDKGVYEKYKNQGFTANCLIWTASGGTQTHGSINAAEALMHSCNYFFYDIGDRLTMDQIDAVAKGFGLGEPTGAELETNIGYRANEETKKLLHTGVDSYWYMADQIMASIGQSDNQFTPLQMCVYISTLVNKGVRYKTTFLNRVVSSDYRELITSSKVEVMSTMPLSDAAYSAAMTGMRLVVSNPAGSGWAYFRNSAYTVAAKTGTAEHGGAGSDHGAFACFAPYEDPQIAIVVYGEKVGAGYMLADVAKAVFDTYFSLSMGDDMVQGENQLG